MPTDTFAPAFDGAARYYDGTGSWASIRAALTGTDVYLTSDPTSGVYSDASLPLIIRGFLSFDTSTLPDGSEVITGGRLRVYGSSIVGTVGTVDLVAGTPASPTTLTTADFDQVGTTLLSDDQIPITSWNTSGYNDFNLNAAGIAAINRSGYTQFALRHSSDRTGSSPASPAAASYYPVEHAGTDHDPILEVTYSTLSAMSGTDSGAETDASSLTTGGPFQEVLDRFTDTTGTNLESHTPSGGGSWTRLYGTGAGTKLKVSAARRAYVDDTSGPINGVYRHSRQITDGYIEGDMVVVSSAGYAALMMRATVDFSPRACYMAVLDAGGWSGTGYIRLIRVSGGSATELGSYNIGALSGTYTVRLAAVGTALEVFVNGVSRITATDATLSSGYLGLDLYNSGGTSATAIQVDNVVVYDQSVGAKSASDAGTETEASAVSARVGAGSGGSQLVRAPIGARIDTLGGTIGSSSAHRAFPCGVLQPNGVKRIIYRRATSHSIMDGVAATKTSADGFATESVIPALLPAGESDYRSGSLKRLASGRTVHVFFTASPRSPTNNIRGWFAYNDDPGLNSALWSTPVRVTNSSFDADALVPSDVVEAADGSLLAFIFGRSTYGASTWELRCSRSTDDGNTWVDRGLIAAYATYGANVVEPQAQVRPNGIVDVTFHVEDGSQHVYLVSSTTPACTAWNTPVAVFAADTNRSGLLRSSDGDLILAHFPTLSFAFAFNQSWDDGSTFGTAINPNSGAASPRHANDVWITPFEIAGSGTSPNVAMVWATENAGQDQADVYYREFTPGSSGTGADTAAAGESASVGVLSSVTPKTGADTAAESDASSVTAISPTAKTVADSAAAADASSVVEVETPVSPAPGIYDLQLGRVQLPTLLDALKESIGEQLDAVGAAVVAGERRAKGLPLSVPVRATGSDPRAIGDRMRRQLRALLKNPAARLGALYLRFGADPEMSGWLLIGDGDLEYAAGGVSFADYKLTIPSAYPVARQRSHLQARRIEIQDRRLATTPRDVKGLIYENTWSENTAVPVVYLPGAAGYQRDGLPLTGLPVAAAAALMSAGAPNLLQGLADGDIVAMTGPPSETVLQQAELGDVIVLDRAGQVATAASAARDLTPQDSYGWEELYGPDQPISYPAGAPDIVVQNGVCRVTLTPATGAINVERLTSSGFAPACTVTPMRGATSTALKIRDASIVEWTPDSAVVKLVQDNTQVSGLSESPVRAETFITLRRGWDAPRVETYLRSPGDYARLRVMPVVTGASTVRFSTSGSAVAIADGTDYGGFGFSLAGTKDPWTLIQPPSGPAIIPAVCTGATKAVGRVVGSLRGIDFYNPASVATSYQSVQLKVTTDTPPESVAALHGQASLLDVRTIPTFLPR